MESSFNTLSLLSEILTAFVAFAAIVASLRVSFGAELTEFQKLRVHFFTASGVLGISTLLLPFVLVEYSSDEQTIARITLLYALFSTITYLIWYLRNRIKIRAPTPLVSAIVIIGYFAWGIAMALAAINVVIGTTLGVIIAFGYWVIVAGGAIFLSFLYEFINIRKSDQS